MIVPIERDRDMCRNRGPRWLVAVPKLGQLNCAAAPAGTSDGTPLLLSPSICSPLSAPIWRLLDALSRSFNSPWRLKSVLYIERAQFYPLLPVRFPTKRSPSFTKAILALSTSQRLSSCSKPIPNYPIEVHDDLARS